MLKTLFLVLLLINSGVLLWELRHNPIESSPSTQLPRLELAKPAIVPPSEIKTAPATSIEQNQVLANIARPVAANTPTSVEKPEKPTTAAPAKTNLDAKPQHDSEPASNKTATNKAETPTKNDAEKTCYEAGPFANAAALKKWTTKYDLKPEQSYYRESQSLIGYQVYYPVGKEADASRNAKQLLKEKGINDMWMIAEGERHIGLSLGVFIDKGRAQQFKSQLQQRGLSAEIQERRKTQQQLFAKIHTDKAKSQQLQKSDANLSHCNH